MKLKITRLNIHYALLQMLFWSTAASAYAFLTQLLEYKGFNETEIGIINSVKLLATVVFQVLIGSFADKHAKTIPLKIIISVLSALTVVFTFILYAVPLSFVKMVILFIGFGGTVTCISPLIDSLSVLYNDHGQKVNYVWGRAAGSAAWAISCVVFGIFCDKVGVNELLIIQIILSALMMLISLIIAKVDFGYNNSSNKSIIEKNKSNVHSVFYIFKNYPKYVCFLLGSSIMFMGYNLGTTFLINVFEELGGSNMQYGIANFVMAISEVPSAYFIVKLRNKIPIEKMMIFCALFMTFKTAFATYCSDINIIIIAQSCEMLGFGLFYAGSVYLVDKILPKQDCVKGVSLINAATVGAGEGIGAFFSGIIKNNKGLHNLMQCSVLVSFVAIIVMIVMCMLHNKLRIRNR